MSTIASGQSIILRDRLASDAEHHMRWLSEGQWQLYDAPWEAVQPPRTEEERERFRTRFLKSCGESQESPRKRATIATHEGKPLGWVNRYADERFTRAEDHVPASHM